MPIPVPTAGDDVDASWGRAVVTAVSDLDIAISALDSAQLRITRQAQNPAHQAHQTGSTVTLDWVVALGVQTRYRVSRRSSPVDPEQEEWWTGSAWGAAPVWIASATSQAAIGGWTSEGVYAVSVEIGDADGAVSNRATWAILIGDATQSEDDPMSRAAPVITVTPQTQTVRAVNGVVRVGHSSGTRPGQILVQVVLPDSSVKWWVSTGGGAIGDVPTWEAFTPGQQGDMPISIPLATVGSYTVYVTARIDAQSPTAERSGRASVAIARAAADDPTDPPEIVRAGNGILNASGTADTSRDIAWVYTGSSDQARVHLVRTRGSVQQVPTGITNGVVDGWKTATLSDTTLPLTAHKLTVQVQPGDSLTISVYDGETPARQSNTLAWEAIDFAAGAPTATVELGPVSNGMAELRWKLTSNHAAVAVLFAHRHSRVAPAFNDQWDWVNSRWIAAPSGQVAHNHPTNGVLHASFPSPQRSGAFSVPVDAPPSGRDTRYTITLWVPVRGRGTFTPGAAVNRTTP